MAALSAAGRQRRLWALLFILLFFGKSYHLGTQSFWIDEGHTWYDALAGNIMAPAGTTPGYALIITTIGKLLPLNEWSLRLPSVIAGCLGLFFLFHCYPAGATRQRFALLVIGACQPFLYWHDQDARMYSLLFCSAAAVLYYTNRLRQCPGGFAAWCGFVGWNTFGIYNHLHLVIITAGSLLLLIAIGNRRRAFIAGASIGVLLIPLLVFYWSRIKTISGAAMAPEFSERLFDTCRSFYYLIFGYTTFSLTHSPMATRYLLPAAVIALGALGYAVWRQPASPALRTVALGFVLFPAAAVTLPYLAGMFVLYPRYLMICLPGAILLVSNVSFARGYGVIAFTVLILIYLFGIYHYHVDPAYQKNDWRSLSRHIAAATASHTPIYIYATVPLVLRYYLPGWEQTVTGAPAQVITGLAPAITAGREPAEIILFGKYRHSRTGWHDAATAQGLHCQIVDVSRLKIVQLTMPRQSATGGPG